MLRHAVTAGLLAHGHLISPLGHLVLHFTDPDWPPKLKSCFADIVQLLKTVLSICSNSNLSGTPDFDPGHFSPTDLDGSLTFET